MAVLRIHQFDGVFKSRMSEDRWRPLIELRSRPGFLNGLFKYRERILPYFSDNIILNKVVTEAWRFEMLVYALYLYDTRDMLDPRSGLTTANLQKICAEQNCASRGRVMAITAMMRIAGYLRKSRSPGDSRVVQLEPSEGFILTVEGWNRRIFEIIDAIIPEGQLAQRHELEPRFGWNMRKRGAEGLLRGWKLLDPFPEVSHFVTRDGGWMLLLTCVSESVKPGDDVFLAPVSIDLAAFGKTFGVSRSHLRRLLESAYAHGLLEEAPRNGTNIVLAPKLVASFLNCMASELSYYRRHATAT